MEYLLRDELRALGADDAREALAGVHFSGDIGLAYRACLWSRLASRILLVLAEFDAADADALYAGAQSIDWAEHLDVAGTFAVDAVGGGSALRHSQYVALRVKDAIADQFRERCGERPSVDVAQPSIRVNVHLHKGRAGIALDLAGTPLHRRGWRQGTGEAPLKENLAAAILLRSDWPRIAREGGALVDPMCGSATLLVEGALMAADVAPACVATISDSSVGVDMTRRCGKPCATKPKRARRRVCARCSRCSSASTTIRAYSPRRNAMRRKPASKDSCICRGSPPNICNARKARPAGSSSAIRRTANGSANGRHSRRCIARSATGCAKGFPVGRPASSSPTTNSATRSACARTSATRSSTARSNAAC
jgi:hypothetical protein